MLFHISSSNVTDEDDDDDADDDVDDDGEKDEGKEDDEDVDLGRFFVRKGEDEDEDEEEEDEKVLPSIAGNAESGNACAVLGVFFIDLDELPLLLWLPRLPPLNFLKISARLICTALFSDVVRVCPSFSNEDQTVFQSGNPFDFR